MINAAIVGLGWWGKTLVEAVQHDSEEIRFIAGTTRTKTPETQAFADTQKFALVDEYEAPPDRLERDLLAFVDRLNGRGLITFE